MKRRDFLLALPLPLVACAESRLGEYIDDRCPLGHYMQPEFLAHLGSLDTVNGDADEWSICRCVQCNILYASKFKFPSANSDN